MKLEAHPPPTLSSPQPSMKVSEQPHAFSSPFLLLGTGFLSSVSNPTHLLRTRWKVSPSLDHSCLTSLKFSCPFFILHVLPKPLSGQLISIVAFFCGEASFMF